MPDPIYDTWSETLPDAREDVIPFNDGELWAQLARCASTKFNTCYGTGFAVNRVFGTEQYPTPEDFIIDGGTDTMAQQTYLLTYLWLYMFQMFAYPIEIDAYPYFWGVPGTEDEDPNPAVLYLPGEFLSMMTYAEAAAYLLSPEDYDSCPPVLRVRQSWGHFLDVMIGALNDMQFLFSPEIEILKDLCEVDLTTGIADGDPLPCTDELTGLKLIAGDTAVTDSTMRAAMKIPTASDATYGGPEIGFYPWTYTYTVYSGTAPEYYELYTNPSGIKFAIDRGVAVSGYPQNSTFSALPPTFSNQGAATGYIGPFSISGPGFGVTDVYEYLDRFTATIHPPLLSLIYTNNGYFHGVGPCALFSMYGTQINIGGVLYYYASREWRIENCYQAQLEKDEATTFQYCHPTAFQATSTIESSEYVAAFEVWRNLLGGYAVKNAYDDVAFISTDPYWRVYTEQNNARTTWIITPCIPGVTYEVRIQLFVPPSSGTVTWTFGASSGTGSANFYFDHDGDDGPIFTAPALNVTSLVGDGRTWTTVPWPYTKDARGNTIPPTTRTFRKEDKFQDYYPAYGYFKVGDYLKHTGDIIKDEKPAEFEDGMTFNIEIPPRKNYSHTRMDVMLRGATFSSGLMPPTTSWDCESSGSIYNEMKQVKMYAYVKVKT